MEKIARKIEELHKLLDTALKDGELDSVLRALYVGIWKELDSAQWAVQNLVVQGVSKETARVNEAIETDWLDPDVQVDPNSPHVFRVEETVEDVAVDVESALD